MYTINFISATGRIQLIKDGVIHKDLKASFCTGTRQDYVLIASDNYRILPPWELPYTVVGKVQKDGVDQAGPFASVQELLIELSKYGVTGSGAPTPSNCNSLKPTKTGQTTSYDNFDDGWFQFGRDIDFFTLSWDNPFGNTNRFTDVNGLQIYGNDVVIDWSSYDVDGGEVTGFLISLTASSVNQGWDDWMANAPYSTGDLSISGFYLANVNQAVSILNWSDTSHLLYSPFNYGVSNTARILWLSTTDGVNSNQALTLGINNGIVVRGKFAANLALLSKQFTLAELGL